VQDNRRVACQLPIGAFLVILQMTDHPNGVRPERLIVTLNDGCRRKPSSWRNSTVENALVGLEGEEFRCRNHSSQARPKVISSGSGAGPNPKSALLLVDRHNVLGWTITAIVCPIRDRIWLQVAPTPSTGNGWPPTGTVQRPFICESLSHWQQVRPVTVRAETRQISSQAFWTLNAMANPGSHGMCR
jgi:hypothetical protein